MTSEDISLSMDPLGMRLFVTGDTEKRQLIEELVPQIDKAPAEPEEGAEEPEELTLQSYPIKAADPALVLRVTQTLLASLPGVRLDVDLTNAQLIALAHPTEHELIAATLQNLEGQIKQFRVIPLKRVDPELAVMAVNKFFQLTSDDEDAVSDPNAPIVDGDPISMQLWVRGTELQISQIEELITTLETADDDSGIMSNVRLIPLTGARQQDPHRHTVRDRAFEHAVESHYACRRAGGNRRGSGFLRPF